MKKEDEKMKNFLDDLKKNKKYQFYLKEFTKPSRKPKKSKRKPKKSKKSKSKRKGIKRCGTKRMRCAARNRSPEQIMQRMEKERRQQEEFDKLEEEFIKTNNIIQRNISPEERMFKERLDRVINGRKQRFT